MEEDQFIENFSGCDIYFDKEKGKFYCVGENCPESRVASLNALRNAIRKFNKGEMPVMVIGYNRSIKEGFYLGDSTHGYRVKFETGIRVEYEYNCYCPDEEKKRKLLDINKKIKVLEKEFDKIKDTLVKFNPDKGGGCSG